MTLRPLNIIDLNTSKPFQAFQKVGPDLIPIVIDPQDLDPLLKEYANGCLYVESDPPDCNAGQIEVEEDLTLF